MVEKKIIDVYEELTGEKLSPKACDKLGVWLAGGDLEYMPKPKVQLEVSGLLEEILLALSQETAITRLDGFEAERKRLNEANDKAKLLKDTGTINLLSNITSLFDATYNGKPRELLTKLENNIREHRTDFQAEIKSLYDSWLSSAQMVYGEAARTALLSATKERISGKLLNEKFEAQFLSTVEPYLWFADKVISKMNRWNCYEGNKYVSFNLFDPNDGAWKIFKDDVEKYAKGEEHTISFNPQCINWDYGKALEDVCIHYTTALIETTNEFLRSEQKWGKDRVHATISLVYQMHKKLGELKEYRTKEAAQPV